MSVLTNKLKSVETGSTSFEKSTTNTSSTLSDESLKFTMADRNDLNTRSLGNLFSSFNLPILDFQKNLFSSGGTYFNTAISGINQNNVIVVEIPRNQYGELIDGKSINLKLPILSSSTETVINCYGTYFDENVNISNANTRLSDGSDAAQYFGVEATSGNSYNSNVCFLFSNEIKSPQINTGTTWNAWSTVSKFDTANPTTSTTSKQFARLDGSNVDEVVGIAYLDKGFFVITHPTIVDNFIYSGAVSSGYNSISSGLTYSGDSGFTQIYFTSSTSAQTSFNSVTNEYIQRVYALAMQDEFFQSTNPTFAQAYPNGNPDNEPVYITEIGLYNENDELIAIAKTNEPIPKTKFNIASFEIQLKL